MATLALSVVGQFAGAMVGGPIGATVGRALGALAGSAIDGVLFGERSEPAGFDLRISGSAEGGSIPRLYGWGRLAGNIIWARELELLSGETAGAKGLGGPEEEEIGASFAIAFCEGRVARLGRLWADGQVLDTRGLNLRFYQGDDTQLPDSLIEATQGAGHAPAYRGLCYLVIENLPLGRFGNRIPQISAELCRVVGELEPAIRAVTVIPGATEFGYDPVPRVQLLGAGEGKAENEHLAAGISNWSWSIDELTALCPNLEHVALVVTWFGDDLRCGHCTIAPRVEAAERTVSGAEWSVAGLTRAEAQLVSSHGGSPAYGGTPSDASVRAAIADLRARGLKVTLYPLMMMDIAAGNGMPDPHGEDMQPAYPWRGRISCHPAPGQPGTPDGTGTAAAQVAAIVPGYRDMILHYAGLAVEAGGVDAMLIGSEMVALTGVRGEDNSFPFVGALVELASDVRAIVGPDTRLSYAADWTEYWGCQRDGGRFFHLDPLWASPDIDAIGIDCYMPLSDWREGRAHLDAAGADSIYDLDYLGGNVAGGEGFDWYYASDADRRAQVRTPITDGAHGEGWIWRYKDIRAFWSQYHHDRPGGVRSVSPTAWVPGSKPLWLTEVGCGAVDKGANQPNIFGDDKSAEGGRPYFSNGLADGLMQRQFLRAHHRFWADPDNNPPGMVDTDRLYCWTWDARPYPAFPAMTDVWADGPNHRTGHWLTGRLGALASDELVAVLADEHGCAVTSEAAAPLIGGMVRGGPETARDAIEPVLELTGQYLAARAGSLVALSVGAGAEAEILRDDLAADEAPTLSHRRGAAAERPGRLALSHMDRERDYLTATATALRGAGPLVAETVPIALDGAGARLAAERLLDGRAAAQDTISFALPPNRIALEPGDLVVVEGQGQRPFAISEIRDGLVRSVTARSEPLAEAIATGVDRSLMTAGAPMAQVAPVIVSAHLPPLPGDVGRSRLVLGAFARPWPGTVRVTDPTTGAVRAELSRPAVMGVLVQLLDHAPSAVWDRANGLEIILSSGHLADMDVSAVLGGSNRLAVETDSDDWEVIGFAEAELVAPRHYRLRGLLRGLEGTDHVIGTASPGRRVLVMDGRLAVLPVEPGHIGTSHVFRAFAGSGDLAGQDVTVGFDATPALPMAPVHLRARRVADDAIRFDWIRRSRADSADWGLAEPGLDHAPESWRLTIFDGVTALRSVNLASGPALYPLADQVADFGGPAPTFTYTICQLSPQFGAGHAATGAFHE